MISKLKTEKGYWYCIGIVVYAIIFDIPRILHMSQKVGIEEGPT